jgi:cation:H+ antiporter
MLGALGLLAVGAVVLYVGAEAAVRGAAALARALGIRAFVLGALLFGIDLESLGTAVAASARGETALAAGEIVGTVLFLFGAAFGAALLVARGPIPSPGPVPVLAPALHLVAGAFALTDRYVARLEGVFLVAMYLAYVGLLVRGGRIPRGTTEIERESDRAGRQGRTPVNAALAAGGLALVAAGATVVVAGATRFTEASGLAAGFVGAAILGVLVSLDELLLEVLPVRRGQAELATGNLFGTLPAMAAGVMGLAALVHPLDVDSAGAAGYLAMAFLYAVVATVFLARGRAGRWLGAFVLGSYAAWLVVSSTL